MYIQNNENMKNITVYCGANSGNNPIFTEQAFALGKYMAEQGIGLVYGGGNVGLMGAVANGVIQNQGEGVGIIPQFLLDKELGHGGLTELIIVENMHQRKAKMYEMCDAIIALPGGFGTMEELFEMLTWGQLGLHEKPIALLNTMGYYDSLLAFFDDMTKHGLLRPEHRAMVIVDDNIEALIEKMKAYEPTSHGKWLHKDEIKAF